MIEKIILAAQNMEKRTIPEKFRIVLWKIPDVAALALQCGFEYVNFFGRKSYSYCHLESYGDDGTEEMNDEQLAIAEQLKSQVLSAFPESTVDIVKDVER